MTFQIKTDYFQFIGKNMVFYSNIYSIKSDTYLWDQKIYPMKLFDVVIHQSNQKFFFCSSEQAGR